ncbi:MAG TPA: hypothetical protein VGH97_04725 [Thermoanaerobaculia bacterium]|jgi:hypothetical protein
MEARATNPPAPADYLKTRAAFIGPGWWLPWIGGLAYVIGSSVGVRYVGRHSGEFGHPGDNPPWWFIRTDFVQGICLGAGIVLCLVIAILTWKRYPGNTRAMLWVNILWSGGGAWKAILIALNTRHLFDPTRAETSRWPTFNSWQTDPLIWTGWVAVMVGALAFASWPGLVALRKRRG